MASTPITCWQICWAQQCIIHIATKGLKGHPCISYLQQNLCEKRFAAPARRRTSAIHQGQEVLGDELKPFGKVHINAIKEMAEDLPHKSVNSIQHRIVNTQMSMMHTTSRTASQVMVVCPQRNPWSQTTADKTSADTPGDNAQGNGSGAVALFGNQGQFRSTPRSRYMPTAINATPQTSKSLPPSHR